MNWGKSDHAPRLTYTGREWDADAGLYYFRARGYDPESGRFVGEDPIGLAAGDANVQRRYYPVRGTGHVGE